MLCQTLMLLTFPTKSPMLRPASVGSVDSEVRPVRCHWENAIHASLCDEAIAGIEAAWSLQVDGLGWPESLMDEDGILDVYVSSDAGGGAYAYGPWEDAEIIDSRAVSPAYIVIDPGFDTWFYWTMLHEFNHVLQYSIDVTEPRYVPWEGTATAVESWSDPSLLPMDEYIEDFQATPWVGLLGDGWMLDEELSIWSLYEYGAALWLFHLDATTGDGRGSAGLDLWLNGAQSSWENEPDFIDAAGMATGTWVDGWMDFAIDRVAVGSGAPPEWAATYGAPQFAIGIEASVTAAELPITITPTYMPLQTGAVYAEVTGLDVGERIVIEADGDDSVRWAVFAVDGEDGDWVERSSMNWVADSASVVVGAVNLGPGSFDSDDPIEASDVRLTIRRGGPDGEPGDPKVTGCGCSAATDNGSRNGMVLGLLGVALVGWRRRSGASERRTR